VQGEVFWVIDELKDRYDAVVVGGGAAGLNGAVILGRSRRSVLVIDAGEPRNAPAGGIHGLLGLEGIAPSDYLERGRAEVRGYGGHITSGVVVSVARDGEGFEVSLADGREVHARRLLVASGLVDELPAVPGLAERWGRDVLHCPYCHGWEVRDQAIGVLATGPMAMHQVMLFRQLSENVVLFTHTTQPPEGEEAEQLAARGVAVVNGEVTGVEIVDDRLAGIRLAHGTVVPRQALAVQSRMVARTGFLAGLGPAKAEHPAGMGEHIPTEMGGRTEVSGLWVAGNVGNLAAQVGAAAAEGAFAAAQINADLAAEDTRLAVAAARERASAEIPG
jgi:thioredoxin reductase